MLPLIPDNYYHIYNRANGDEKIFKSEENYRFFLEKFHFYIVPIADVFSFCLLPNHFHFLVRIKSEKEIYSNLSINRQGFGNLDGLSIDKIISNQFGNFFNSYAKAFNKQNNRKGSVFMKTFKRKHVADKKYLLKLVHYIHHNPVEARLSKTPEGWKHSSYQSILKQNSNFIKTGEVIAWFDTKENFTEIHSQLPELNEKAVLSN
jgi:REP element-mobilizing transposase RayT